MDKNFFQKLKAAGKAVLPLAVGGAAMLLATEAAHAASTAGYTEFDSSATRLGSWLQGGYGKSAAIAGTSVGVGVAAFTKQFVPTMLGVGIAVAIPVALSVINGSFSAVI